MRAGEVSKGLAGSGVFHKLGMSDSKKFHKFWQKVEMGVVCLLIIIVWSLLSLPIVFFHLPVEEIPFDVKSNVSNAPVNSSVCSQSTLYLTVENMCFQELDNVLTDSCPQDVGESIVVVRKEEETIGLLNQGLQFIGASEECRKEVVPFLCQYYFGLCSDSGSLIQPTSSQCERIKNSICPREWEAAVQFNLELPDCSDLPSEPSLCQSNNNETSSEESNSNVERPLTFQNKTTKKVLECSHGFYQENGSQLCIPSCYTFTEYEESLSIAIDVMLGVTVFVGFLSAIAVIVISCLRHRRMLTFPSVFIVYMVLDILALAFTVLVMYMDRPGLFCSSMNLIESIRNVTPFCVISGMLFTYILCQMAVWWLFHTASLFWKVIFPFHSRSVEVSGRVKYIHITCVIAGILFPFVPIITSMSKLAVDVRERAENGTSSHQLFLSEGLGFFSSRFPAILCTGSDRDAVFYSLILPIDLILATGCTLLLIIFWSVHRQNMKVKVDDASNLFKFGTAEKKLLVVFSYYVVLASVALTAFTLSIRNSSNFITSIQQYFLCEQGGHDSSSPCSRDYISQSFPSLTTLSYILLGLFPVVNLIYAMNLKELKEMAQKLRLKRKKAYYNSDTPSTGSTVAMTSTFKRNP